MILTIAVLTLQPMSISANLNSIKRQLPAHCKLIAVTKTHSVDVIQEAYDAGHRVFGENKVQEMTEKAELLPKDIEWHLIGHLQTNKVKYMAAFVSMIHAVDSLKLLVEINKQALKVNRVIPCLLQVHIADEETKFGFSENELHAMLSSSELRTMNNIQVKGLMGMATFTNDENKIRSEFKTLRSVFEKLKTTELPTQVQMIELSMGMSSDYQIAIEEGSTMIRVGSAIFGQRDYSNVKP
jgi:pyridoxal phosphate enzyme (YggS family)